MSESEMVRRVARAAAFARRSKHDVSRDANDYWEHLYSAQKEELASARAAIAAMRELTDDMVKAAIEADDKRTGNQTIRHMHRAMIDAALAPDSEVVS